MEVEYNSRFYELKKATEEELIFKRKQDFSELNTEDLEIRVEELEDELKYATERYDEYNERVEEFRYCGYTEEDPDFHGMCLHLNGLSEEVDKIEDILDKAKTELEKR